MPSAATTVMSMEDLRRDAPNPAAAPIAAHGSNRAQRMLMQYAQQTPQFPDERCASKHRVAYITSLSTTSCVLMKAARLGIRVRTLKSCLEYLHKECRYPRLVRPTMIICYLIASLALTSELSHPLQTHLQLLLSLFRRRKSRLMMQFPCLHLLTLHSR